MRGPAGERQPVGALVSLLFAATQALALASAQDAAPVFSADIWKRQVALQEPILVRLEMRNPTGERMVVVPPYVRHLREGDWQLSFTVLDENGDPVPRTTAEGKTVFIPALYDYPWWIRTGYSEVPDLRLPWEIPARGSAYMWIEFSDFYPLDEPGRYHITFDYAARREMLVGWPPAGPPPDGGWEGTLEADAGWVNVTEPPEADRELADYLVERRRKSTCPLALVSFEEVFRFGDEAEARRERFARSVYEPYVAFCEIQYWAYWGAYDGEPMRLLMEKMDRLAVACPDFPLLYQFPTLTAYAKWRATRREREAMLTAAQETGDQALLGWVRNRLHYCDYDHPPADAPADGADN